MTVPGEPTAVAAGAMAGAGCSRLRVVWWPGLAVALGAAVATAHGLFEVATAARVPGGIAWLYPLITDGLALVAYAATARLTGRAARYAWTVVIIAAGLSGLAQAVYLAADSTVTAPAVLRFGVGAWPALAAAVVAHLLYLLTAHTESGAGAQSPVHETVQSPFSVNTAPAGVQADLGGVFNQPVQPDLHGGWAEIELNPSGDPVNTAVNTGSGDPSGSGEVAGRSVRERAETLAVRYAQRHGTWPTVSELEAQSAVSRGTAHAVLKALRDQPLPLHLISTEAPPASAAPDQDPDDEQDTQP